MGGGGDPDPSEFPRPANRSVPGHPRTTGTGPTDHNRPLVAAASGEVHKAHRFFLTCWHANHCDWQVSWEVTIWGAVAPIIGRSICPLCWGPACHSGVRPSCRRVGSYSDTLVHSGVSDLGVKVGGGVLCSGSG